MAGGCPASLRPGRWLDLYSGTGSVGIEALSRGCSEVIASELYTTPVLCKMLLIIVVLMLTHCYRSFPALVDLILIFNPFCFLLEP